MPVKTAKEHNNSYANSIELLYCKTESTNNGQNLDFHCLFELQYDVTLMRTNETHYFTSLNISDSLIRFTASLKITRYNYDGIHLSAR